MYTPYHYKAIIGPNRVELPIKGSKHIVNFNNVNDMYENQQQETVLVFNNGGTLVIQDRYEWIKQLLLYFLLPPEESHPDYKPENVK